MPDFESPDKSDAVSSEESSRSQPTHPDTEPSPPPSVQFEDVCRHCVNGREETTYGFLPGVHQCDVCGELTEHWNMARVRTAGLRALDHHAVPNTEPFRGSLHVNADGEVVPGPHVPARDWLDYGKDTGPRLRIKSVDVAPEVEKAAPDPNGPDPGDVREAHEAYRRAVRDDDDHAIAKLFPDVLDELHSKDPGARTIPELDWTELELALAAEWREWGQAHAVRGRAVAFRKTPDACACEALVPLDTGDPYHIKSEERAVRQAWKRALGDPRQAAALLVRGATEELHKVRRGELAAEHSG